MGSLNTMRALAGFFSFLYLFSPATAEQVTGATCDLCLAVVEGLENFITDDTTMDQILDKVEEICSSLGPLEGLCIQTINSYLPDIIENILEGQLSPMNICQLINLCEAPGTTLTPEPPAWMYIETMLEGGTVISVEPDKTHIWMQHKHGRDDQMWRIEHDGCLRNKAHMDRCLGIGDNAQGSVPSLYLDNGLDIEHWEYTEDFYVENLGGPNGIWNHLSLNVIWADVPLITDGAGVNVWHKDNTLSMKWKFVSP